MGKSENKRVELCPLCKSKMIEDASEEINILPDSSIQIDIISPAWVCSSFCGYYEKIN